MTISKNFNKVILILGPTASGKTGVAIKLAKKIGGEIISADSRAIYRGMDIGTAKPSIRERDGVPHFGFDLVSPEERFTVADFKEYALEKIREIQSRKKIPIVVGGTGLYIDALVYDYQFSGLSGVKQLRKEEGGSFLSGFEATPESLQTAPDRIEICTNYLLIGIRWEREALRERIWERVNKLFTQELYEETRRLVKKYGFKIPAMTTDIYEYAWKYLEGELSLEEAKKQCFYRDWHLARRQMTWFKRNSTIKWLELEKVYPFVIKYIQNEQGK